MRSRHVLFLAALAVAGCIDDPRASVDGDDAGVVAAGGAGGEGGESAGAGGPPVGGGPPDVRPALLETSPETLVVADGDTRSVTITNSGGETATITQLVVQGSATFVPLMDGVDPRRSAASLEDPDADGTPGLSGGAEFRIAVEHEGDESAHEQGTLVILAEGLPSLEIQLTDFESETCLEATPRALEWQTTVGGMGTESVELRPCLAGATVQLSGVTFEGEGANVFRQSADSPSLPTAISDATALAVEFRPVLPVESQAALVLEIGGAPSTTLRVPLRGVGRENQCPVAVVNPDAFRVPVGDVIALNGAGSFDPDGPDGRPVRYEWVVMNSPSGSTAAIHEAIPDLGDPSRGLPDDSTTSSALIFVDLEGTYTLMLRVYDEFGLGGVDCPEGTAIVTIDSRPVPAIEILLVPEIAAGDVQPDLDLHFRHPLSSDGWFYSPGDCYFGNPNPDWGILLNESDNPVLSTDRPGQPEGLTFQEPENTELFGAPYRVAVYGMDVPENTLVPFRLHIFLRGELVYASPDALSIGPDELIEIAEIEWPAVTVRESIQRFQRSP